MAVDRSTLTQTFTVPAHWRGPLIALSGALLLLLAAFHSTYWSMVETWSRTETFTHGFLIIPIVLFLLWRQRGVLAGMTPQPVPAAAAVLAVLGFVWLLGELAEVVSVRQFSAVLMVPVLVWLFLGSRILWQLQFPLAYLLFAVPFGQFLVQPLMVYTADFTVGMVRFTGIPVYRDGMFFELPTGRWSVVEACSGIRYLIASVSLGALYAHLTYRTWLRRTLFMVAAVLVPIVANGLRAYMIVMIGHLSDMQLAVGVDHLLYGWVFFGIVIFLMFWVGSFWREDHGPVTAYRAAQVGPARNAPTSQLVTACVLAAVVILATPAYAAWMDREGAWPEPDLGAIPATVGEWRLTDAHPVWKPGYHNTRDEWHVTYARGGQSVGLYIGFYAEQSQHGQMVTWRNTLEGRGDDTWRRLRGGRGYERASEVHLTGPETRVVAWQWYWVDGTLTTSPHVVKGKEAISRLLGGTDDAANIVIFSEYETRPAEAQQAMEEFAEVGLPVIRERLGEVAER